MRIRLLCSISLLFSFLACGGAETDQTTTVSPPPPPLDEPSEPDPEDPDEDEPELVMSDDLCDSDADCVPAGCCHADACVGRDSAPDCQDMMCTQECRYGTLDCGGACLCHEGRCAARLSEPPAALQEAIEAQ